MINVYGNKTERSDLPTTVERPDWAGAYWQGIPHRELADTLVETVQDNGFKVIQELWHVGMEGNGLVGGLDIVNPLFADLKGARYAIAVIHDNIGRRAITLTAGARVSVCENGILTGEYILRKRHTKNLPLREQIDGAVKNVGAQLQTVGNMIEWMKTTEVDADQIFVSVGRKKMLNWTRLGRVIDEYYNPSFEEFKQFSGTAFGVYNAFNHIIKEVSPLNQVNFLRSFTTFLGRENNFIHTISQ